MAFNPSLSVVHLSMRKGKTSLSVGSGVIYERDSKLYIATAWHNLSGRHSETLKPLSRTGGIPDNVVASVGILVNSPTGEMTVRMPFTIPVETVSRTCYLVHPQGWPRVDVAILPLDRNQPYDMEFRASNAQETVIQQPLQQFANDLVSLEPQPIQKCAGAFSRTGIPPEQLIDAGADLFVLGYPRGIADFTAAPIWKRATVASDPHLGWNREQKFLIDCASREGMSGAPVVAISRDGIVRIPGASFAGDAPAAALHGIYVGRLIDEQVPEDDRLFEAQIGTVWKRAVIDQIIDAGVYSLHSSEIGVPSHILMAAISKKWPSDPLHFEKVLAHPEFQWGLVQVVMEELNGNVNPYRVGEEVMTYARQLQLKSTGGG